MWGVGCGFWVVGFGLRGVGFEIWGLELGLWSLGFGVQGLGFQVFGFLVSGTSA